MKVITNYNKVLKNLFFFQVLAEKGNDLVNEEYEKYIPPYYRKPHQHDVE